VDARCRAHGTDASRARSRPPPPFPLPLRPRLLGLRRRALGRPHGGTPAAGGREVPPRRHSAARARPQDLRGRAHPGLAQRAVLVVRAGGGRAARYRALRPRPGDRPGSKGLEPGSRLEPRRPAARVPRRARGALARALPGRRRDRAREAPPPQAAPRSALRQPAVHQVRRGLGCGGAPLRLRRGAAGAGGPVPLRRGARRDHSRDPPARAHRGALTHLVARRPAPRLLRHSRRVDRPLRL
jgi:hypothetical protein